MTTYTCQECLQSNAQCPHADNSHCEDGCVEQWGVSRSCQHGLVECFVCLRVWKGDRTLCQHSSTDVIESLMSRVG